MDLNPTNTTKLHTCEAVQCLWVSTPILFRLSSSSYIQSTKKITPFLSFSQKVIMVLIVLELHESLWVFIYFTYVPFFLNNCVWISFAHLPSHILATLPSLCSWCSPSLHSWSFSKFLLLFQARILDVLQAHIFKTLLGHILVALLDHVLVTLSL